MDSDVFSFLTELITIGGIALMLIDTVHARELFNQALIMVAHFVCVILTGYVTYVAWPGSSKYTTLLKLLALNLYNFQFN